MRPPETIRAMLAAGLETFRASFEMGEFVAVSMR
jgi:hypothetical protein